MKRFDVAAEISKQLISVSTALLAGIAAFQDKIIVNELAGTIYWFLVFFFVCMLISILAGIIHLGAIVNGIETSEKNTQTFVSVFDNPVALISCGAQQILFCAGILFLVLILIVDRSIPPGL